MTTTVTLETHGWPVEVVSTSEHYHHSDQSHSEGIQSTTTFVPKNTKRSFHITDTTTLVFRELPADAEGLGPNPRAVGSVCADACAG